MPLVPPRIVATCLLTAFVTLAPLAGAAVHPYTATPVQDYAGAGDAGLFKPTDVAVGKDGTVFIADGVHDRVAAFAADGRFQRNLAGGEGAGDVGPLPDPIGITVDTAGALWMTATNGVATRWTGAWQNYALRSMLRDENAALDLTDVAVNDTGTIAWFVDNDHHRLMRVDLAANDARFVGGFGQDLGQLYYPFQAVVAANGDVLVTDVINGRVAVFDERGRPVRQIGQYGVSLGEFYRPTGLALDADGNVWVADSVLGVIQAYTQTGRLLDVLRDPNGAPLKFAGPMGIAFDPSGDLYVVERDENRVRRLRVMRDPAALPTEDRTPTRGIASDQPRTCTACHLEWMKPLDVGQPTALIAPPDDPRDYPAVSRADACLSCHDGSVVDSRQAVWLEHGHRTGITPPADMTVPERLPLADDKVVCRTCHSAHTRGGSGNELKDAVFLRVEGSPAQLCTECHGGFDTGPQHGMHPLAEVPKDAVPAGTFAAIDERGQMTCYACHNAHGTVYEHLLVANPLSNDACVSCHAAAQPQIFAEQHRSMHGKLPKLSDSQAAVARGFAGGELGPNNTLLCLTCHAVHEARSDRNLLVFNRAERDATCTGCHAQQQTIVGTTHDLRTNHPDAVNLLGETAAASGVCSSCHGAHQFARETVATKLDPSGECITCHRADGLASAATLGDHNHPEASCGDCHNPHATTAGNFLAAEPVQLCSGCHRDQATLVSGPHSLNRDAAKWPSAAAETQDACLACHRPHGDAEHGLWRVAPLASVSVMSDAACLACHENAMPQSDAKLAMLHARGVNENARQSGLPLSAQADGTALIGCNTCHNPHGSGEAAALLRSAAANPSQAVCTTCHPDQRYIDTIGHAPEFLSQAGYDGTGCRPCHVVHGPLSEHTDKLLWPTWLSSDIEPNAPAADRYCFACHSPSGPVLLPDPHLHPETVMYNVVEPNAPGYLPLFNSAGDVAADGMIACETCHLTHGRDRPAPMPAAAELLDARELRARLWHLRTVRGESICTTCHGVDTLRRFIYFHDPRRRGGSIQPPAAALPRTATP